MKTIIYSLVCVLFATMAIPAEGAAIEVATIELAPFGFYTDDQKPTGMTYEIMEMIAKKAGVEIANHGIYPYPRVADMVAQGEAVATIRYVNDVLERDAIQVVTVFPLRNVVVIRKDSPFRSLEDLYGKTIATVRGAYYGDKYANELIKKYATDGYVQSVKMLMAERVDGAIGSEIGLFYAAKNTKLTPELFGEPIYVNSSEMILHLSKTPGNEKTAEALKIATEALKEDGSIQKVIDKYIVEQLGEFKQFFANSDSFQ